MLYRIRMIVKRDWQYWHTVSVNSPFSVDCKIASVRGIELTVYGCYFQNGTVMGHWISNLSSSELHYGWTKWSKSILVLVSSRKKKKTVHYRKSGRIP